MSRNRVIIEIMILFASFMIFYAFSPYMVNLFEKAMNSTDFKPLEAWFAFFYIVFKLLGNLICNIIIFLIIAGILYLMEKES